MGPGIVIPLVLLAIAVPTAFSWAKSAFKEGNRRSSDEATAPSLRLTSNALRDLPTPPWRVVYEIAEDRLDGVGHVLIGPPGVFAVMTSMDPPPARATGVPDPHDVAAAAMAKAGLDDALRRCGMASDLLVTIHWGRRDDGSTEAVETVPGAIAVSGWTLVHWLDGVEHQLSPSQVDLAWQTVTTAIGRPDPLA